MSESHISHDAAFEQKHVEDLERIRGFRLMDDDFMSKVFEDKSCAALLLRIILNRDDLTVQEVHGQHDLKICRAVPSGWTFWLWIPQTAHTMWKFSVLTAEPVPNGHVTTAASWTLI